MNLLNQPRLRNFFFNCGNLDSNIGSSEYHWIFLVVHQTKNIKVKNIKVESQIRHLHPQKWGARIVMGPRGPFYIFGVHARTTAIDITWVLTSFHKALRYKLFFLKALTKRLWKLTIRTKRLSWLKSLSFLNFNDWRLTINKQFLAKIGRNNKF